MESLFQEDNGYANVVVEYTKDGLRDLCVRKYIDVTKSTFFATIYSYLDSVAIDNSMSRVIVGSFQDKDVQYK